jgi:prevent-host-death family protein
MTRTVTATEARVHLGELLDDVEHNDAITVEQAGNAETVVVPVREAHALSGTSTEAPDWRKSLNRARASFIRDLGDRPRPDLAQMIRDMREERSAQLLDNLR